MRRNMMPLDIQLTYTNFVFVDLLRESLNIRNTGIFYICIMCMYCSHKIWIRSLKYISKYKMLEKGVL